MLMVCWSCRAWLDCATVAAAASARLLRCPEPASGVVGAATLSLRCKASSSDPIYMQRRMLCTRAGGAVNQAHLLLSSCSPEPGGWGHCHKVLQNRLPLADQTAARL